MAIVQKYQVDTFTVVVLIIITVAIVFLVIAAIYLYRLIQLRPPSKGESTFLFGAAILVAFLLLLIFIWCLIRLFTYTVPVEVPDVPTTQTTVIGTATPGAALAGQTVVVPATTTTTGIVTK